MNLWVKNSIIIMQPDNLYSFLMPSLDRAVQVLVALTGAFKFMEVNK